MRNLVFLLILLISVAVVAADFSGTWVLNREKSELGDGPGGRMAAKKMVVEQKENSLKIESTREGRDGGDRTRTQEMTLDGKENKETTEWGESVSTAQIVEDVLTIESTRTFERDGQTNSMEFKQTWTLEEEGKQLVVNMKSNSPWGENELKMVYDKE
ncbi:hypothetical protein EH223_20075 [candidate division KSB1 bacterium]|nr:hypothetical protein [candidate division KSB1 bacterium]RQW00011.1 MAG: hypothetical protein EH223_20075 [candidate division KSB1 bacterium]